MLTNQGWCVVCLDTDTIIGHWVNYKDADQFWSDSMCCPDADEYHWAVFPACEMLGLLEV